MTRATSTLLLVFAELLSAASPFACVPPAVAHGARERRGRRTTARLASSEARGGARDPPPDALDRQSDAKYDRGLAHISADLREDDVVAYQSGTWYVDGTEVGDGSHPTVRYLQVDTLQLVWTHNCEHGVINGFALRVADATPPEDAAGGARVARGSAFVPSEDYAQIGPEQVLARIPVSKHSDGEILVSRAAFDPPEEIVAAWVEE